MAISFCEKYQITNLLEHLKVIYPNELDDEAIDLLKKNILEENGNASSITEEIRSLFQYDTNKLSLFLIKHHVPIKGNLESSMLKKKESILKKIESLKKKKITIRAKALLSLSILCNGFSINHDLGNQVGRIFTVVPTSSSMEEFIEQSVNENKKLEEEEREFFKKFETYLNENPYIDKKNIYYNLKNLEINYTKRKNEYLDGEYYSAFNEIIFYNLESYSEDDFLRVFGHETFHALSSNGYTSGFGKLFDHECTLTEGMTTILTEEYLLGRASGKTINYPEETLLTKMMAELIGSDVLLYGYSNQNIDIVIEKLGELDGDVDKAKTLIHLMTKMTLSKRQDKWDIQQEYKEQIYLILKEYYQLKVAENPEKAPILTYLIETFYHIRDEYNPILGYELTKAYFSENLKSTCIPHLSFNDELYDFNSARKELPAILNEQVIMLENDMSIGKLAEEKMQK